MSGLKRWQVHGKIFGRLLPIESGYIGPFLIGLRHWGTDPLAPPHLSVPAPTNDQGYAIGYHPAASRVYSNCYFLIEVSASDAEQAKERVEQHELAWLNAFLSCTSPTPYHCEVSWVVGEEGKPHAPSNRVGMRIEHPTPMPTETTVMIDGWLKKFGRDENIKIILELFSKAIQQRLTALSPGEEESSILKFFLVIEAITKGLKIEAPKSLETKEEDIVSRLLKDLSSRKSVGNKVRSIQAASQTINRLKTVSLSEQIQRAADVLQLSPEWKVTAKELATLRNTKLGHGGGSGLSEQDRHRWLIDKQGQITAYQLVQEMMFQYLRQHK